ncbi:MAG: hypothetical protein WKF61_01295 [Luteimonas sp.]
MHKKIMLALACITATVSPSPSYAQSYILYDRWPPSVGARDVYVHSSMPGICDNQVLYALNTWNQAGAKFAYGWPEFYLTSVRQANQSESFDNATVTVEDDPITEYPNALMITSRTFDTSGYIKDVDIAVDTDRMFYSGPVPGEFFCSTSSTEPSPSNKYDFRTLIFHEFGHGIGFGHYTAADKFYCSMYQYRGFGEMQRSLCASEYNEFRSVYGLR